MVGGRPHRALPVPGIFDFDAWAGDDRLSGRVRTTAVMVGAGGWKIAHEHLSVLPEKG